MNRTPRCKHGLAEGLCVVPTCPHLEPRGYVQPNGTARRLRRLRRHDRVHRCHSDGCPNIGTVPVRGGYEYSCQGCLHKVGSRANRQEYR